MSASTAIGMVSASLRNLLVGEMKLSPAMDVTVLSPDESGGARRVNLYLCKITENAFLRNQDWTLRPGAPGSPPELLDAPLSLNLFYLLTPYAPNDPLTGNATAHQSLGEAMRVFHEHPVVPAAYLDPGLADARERLQIATMELDTEELSRLWGTFSQPYRLSVLYQVSTVQLDRLPATARPVPQRVRTVGVPGVEAPFRPPAVTAMTPDRGPGGTVLTFTGTHLYGRRVTVLFGGATVADKVELTGDAFTVPAGQGLVTGLYEVRVDVSGLFRRSFLFEVTP
ncbi:Pvc16 family protein [Streptomyces sp. NPDC050504]|uniref:Pvc16 family protein n=1 Tax=Streptomyces sp. NPDC050504 TaxID=3365618 RepID=UPI003794B4CC